MANLLVRHEGNLERGVRKFGMRGEAGDERDNLRNARLVVRAKKRGAVRDDDVLADESLERGKLLGRGVDHVAVTLASDERAAFIADDARLDTGGRRVGGGVDVGDEAECGEILRSGRGRERRRDVSVMRSLNLATAQLRELGGKLASHVALAGGRRSLLLVVGIGLRVNLHVAHESFKDVAWLRRVAIHGSSSGKSRVGRDE